LLNKELHIKIHYYLALLIAFCLPVARFAPIFIALMLLNWLIEGDFKNKFHLIIKNKFALLFIAFFLLHLIGLIYTQNMDSGLFDIQVKLSLLIFPVVLSSRPIDNEKIQKVFFAFIAGGIVASIILLTRAVYTYEVFGENNFFYQAFSSYLIHPSYLAMYMNLMICWILLNILNGTVYKNKFSNATAFLIVIFFSSIIVLLSSKVGLITMVLEYICLLIYFVISKKKYFTGIFGLVIIVITVYSVMHFVPEISGRINRAIFAVTTPTTNQADAESTAVRLLIWKASSQVISENLILGAGTGDVNDVLMKEYEKRGMTGALEHKLNAHNAFYQVFVSLGLIGFIILILCLLLPLGFAFKAGNGIYIFFIFIIILNFLPESMLEGQAGVMFYAFFNSLFCFSSTPKSLIPKLK
jgi:O-antigen ligase